MELVAFNQMIDLIWKWRKYNFRRCHFTEWPRSIDAAAKMVEHAIVNNTINLQRYMLIAHV